MATVEMSGPTGAFANVFNDRATHSQAKFSDTIMEEPRLGARVNQAVENPILQVPITRDCVASNLQYVFHAVEDEDCAILDDGEQLKLKPGQTHESTSALASVLVTPRQAERAAWEAREGITRASEVYCHGEEREAKPAAGSLNPMHWLHRRNSGHELHDTAVGDGGAQASHDAAAVGVDGAGERRGSFKGMFSHFHHHRKESLDGEGGHASEGEARERGDGEHRRSSIREKLARLHGGHKHEDPGLSAYMDGPGVGEEGGNPLHRCNTTSLRIVLPEVYNGGDVQDAEMVDETPSVRGRTEEAGREPSHRRNSIEDFVARHLHPRRRSSDAHDAFSEVGAA